MAESTGDRDLRLARQAHAGTSFDPETRGRQEIEELAGFMSATHASMRALAETDPQRALLEAEWARFEEAYRRHWRAWLAARARCLSPMITGPSGFPAARNQRRFESEQRRAQELLDFGKRALVAIRRKLDDARTPEQLDAAEHRRLQASILRDIGALVAIQKGEPWDRAAFVNSAAGKLRRSFANGYRGPVRDILRWLRCDVDESRGVTLFGPRHSIWQLLDEPDAPASPAAEEPTPAEPEELEAGEGWRIVRDFQADRVRIYFDSKPSAATRDDLKRAGWRWSPNAGAWQRQLTANAEASARYLAHRSAQEVTR